MSRPQDSTPSWPTATAAGTGLREGRVIGRDIKRVDGPAKATGRAGYGHDQRPANMVYAQFLCSTTPNAEFTLDLAPALAVAGVVDAMAVAEGKTVHLGQPIAAVAAVSPQAAAEGVRALSEHGLELTVLPHVISIEQAMAEGAPAVRRSGNVGRVRSSDEGDIEAGKQEAIDAGGVVLTRTYEVPVQHHACLETHGMVVDYSGGEEATIWASVQGTFAMHDGPPEYLELDPKAVHGRVEHMGGGFGSKFGVGVEGRVACQLSKRLGRPVHLFMDRETEFHAAGNRSGNRVTVTGAMAPDGRITSMESDSLRLGGLSGGSYAGLPYVYTVANTLSAMRSIHTHTDGNRAMRAPGHPQASFGMEGILDELAYANGVDPLTARLANLPEDEWNGVWRRQLERVAREIGWYEHEHRTAPGPHKVDGANEVAIGIGFGVSVWGGGGSRGNEVELRVDRDGRVSVAVGTQDLGTGARTLVSAITAEEFGLGTDHVSESIGSTRLGRGNMSGGSVTTASLAPAVKDAAYKMSAVLLAKAAEATGVDVAELAFTDGGRVTGGGVDIAWTDLCSRLAATGETTHGSWVRDLQASGVHGAQAAKVAVDLLTGHVEVLEMVCMQDIGFVLNHLAAKSQVQGAMVQSLSYALFEERLIDADLGLALNPNFESYKLANSTTIPPMKVIFDPEDERGVVGIGEPPAIPGAAAIAGAVHNACGLRLGSLPLTPDKVLMGLEELRARG